MVGLGLKMAVCDGGIGGRLFDKWLCLFLLGGHEK